LIHSGSITDVAALANRLIDLPQPSLTFSNARADERFRCVGTDVML
jgi:hypothetical protein